MARAKTRTPKPETPERTPDATPVRKPAKRKPRTPDKTPARGPEETKRQLAGGQLSIRDRVKPAPAAASPSEPLADGRLSVREQARTRAAQPASPRPGPLAAGGISIAKRRAAEPGQSHVKRPMKLGGAIEKLIVITLDPTSNLGDVPASDGSGGFTWSPGGGGSVATGQETVDVLAVSKSNVGWSTVAQSSTAYRGGTLTSAGAQNNEVVFEKYLQGGKYTIDVLYANGPTHGIMTIFVDGVQVATSIDMYAAAAGVPAPARLLNVQFTGDQVHTIRCVMTDKNASATTPFYLGTLMGLGLTRTGA